MENTESKALAMTEQKCVSGSMTPPLRRTRWKTPRGSSEGDDFHLFEFLDFVRINLYLLAGEIHLWTYKHDKQLCSKEINT